MLYSKIKRLLDILFSIVILIITSPLLIIIFLLIWLTDGGDTLLRDPLRIGQNEKEFRMYKFRTMIPDAHNEILHNPEYSELKKEWEKNGNKLKINKDSRITTVGKILRKTDLDELPQLINVLKGEMSLVGPRPTYKDEVERHLKKNPKDLKYFKQISTVRPGITGLWQVSGRNEIAFSERLRMDTEYSEKYNLWLDLKILLKTPYIVITRKGAYE